MADLFKLDVELAGFFFLSSEGGFGLLGLTLRLGDLVLAVLQSFAGSPFIFNLGHGILPETPIPHVERLIARVRGWKGSTA